MEDNANKENTPPMCVLLPTCVESEFDAFFNVLRNLIKRSRPEVNHLDHALKIGMTGEAITIEPDDIVVDWNDLQTKPKQFLQWKLLGFWANQNFPLLGKKLFQPSWKPPQRNCVEVIGGRLMTPDEIDVIIARKIKLRVYELSLSPSTFEKLKHFVKVPADIDVCSDMHVQISPKIRSYDIKPKHLKRCYDALRFGKFDDSINGNVKQPMKVSARVPSRPSTSSSTSCRQKFENSAPVLSTPSSMFSRQRLDAHSENDLQSAKRARTDLNISKTFSESGCDTSEMVLVEIKKKIDNLTNWLDPSVAGRDVGNGSERLHVMIFRQKDDEIAQMKHTVGESQIEIENLKKEKSSLEEQVEIKTTLISALKKGVEATSELHIKSESKLAASLSTIDDQKQSIAQYANKVESLGSELRSSKDATATKEREIEQLHKTIELNLEDKTKLEEQLHALNGNVTEMVPKFQRRFEHLKTKLTEAKATNGKLEVDLHELKNIAATKEQEIVQLHKTIELNIADNTKLEGQLNALNRKVMDMLPEFQRLIEYSERNFIEATAENMKLTEELSQLKNS